MRTRVRLRATRDPELSVDTSVRPPEDALCETQMQGAPHRTPEPVAFRHASARVTRTPCPPGGGQARRPGVPRARGGERDAMAGRIVIGTSSWADPGFVEEWYPPDLAARD